MLCDWSMYTFVNLSKFCILLFCVDFVAVGNCRHSSQTYKYRFLQNNVANFGKVAVFDGVGGCVSAVVLQVSGV